MAKVAPQAMPDLLDPLLTHDNDSSSAGKDISKKGKGDGSALADVEADAEGNNAPPSHPPSFFTDHRGNLKAVNIVVRYPCRIFWFLIAVCLFLVFLLNALVFRTADGTPFTLMPDADLKDERSVQLDSFRLSWDQVAAERASNDKGKKEGKEIARQSEIHASLSWVFEADRGKTDAGVFGSVEAIAGMKDAFTIFTDDPAFKEYCLLDYSKRVVLTANETRPCVPPQSPLRMYYASVWDETLVASVIEELKDPTKVALFNSLALCEISGVYCDLNATASDEDRAWTVQLGKKIRAITSTWDMKGDMVQNFHQVTELAMYLMQVDLFKGDVDYGYDKNFREGNPVSQFSRGQIFWGGPLETRNLAASKNDVEKQWNTDGDQRKEFIQAEYLDQMEEQSGKNHHAEIKSYYYMPSLVRDMIMDILARDALLALFSFAFVFVWLRVNTHSWFLAFIGFFEIVFSVPIAWFIFTVVFRLKYFAPLNILALFVVAAIGADDIFLFMDAYKQSQYHPELLCDLETRMSWVYRRTGTAMGITSATTFCAFLVNAFSPLPTIQSFGVFAAMVILVDYILVMSLFCTAVVIYHDRFENKARGGCCCPCGRVVPSNTEQGRRSLENSHGEVELDRVSEFFKTKVVGFIKVPLHRLAMLVVFVTWLSVALWQVYQIGPTQESEQALPEDHPLQKNPSIISAQFPTVQSDSGLKVFYIWGIDEVDRTGVNMLLDPTDIGMPTFVTEFDFNPQCQTDLLQLCDHLKTDPRYTDLIKRKDGLGAVYCFIEELAAYNVKGDATDCDYVKQGEWRNEAWQVGRDDLADIMPPFLEKKACFNDDAETVYGTYHREIGWNGEKMVFAAVAAESNVLDPNSRGGEADTRHEYDQFVAIAVEQQNEISRSCSGAVIMTDSHGIFTFMNNQALYRKSAFTNSVIGVAIAFVILVISTRVLHIALLATLCISAVLVSVVGTMGFLGWSLGSTESLLIGIVAGFSVDYVVHLAHAYTIADGDTYTRLTKAFSELGVSVFNGMITSVAASIPLFFCQLQFFGKFGIFLCLTIVYSWIFANFGFMTILAQLNIPLKEGKFFRL